MAYSDALPASDREFGDRLWRFLRDQKIFPVKGAFWLFDPELNGWNLVIASPRVDAVGTRDAFREFAEVTKSVPASGDQLLRIELVSPLDRTYSALRSVFGETASVEGARLNHSFVNGVFVEDAYLYDVR